MIIDIIYLRLSCRNGEKCVLRRGYIVICYVNIKALDV